MATPQSCAGFRGHARTSSERRRSRRPQARRSSKAMCPRTRRPSSIVSTPRARSCWERRTSTSSRWAARTRTRPSVRSRIPGAAIVCEALFGKDPNDATMVEDFPNDDLRQDLDAGVKGLRLGVPKEYFAVKGMEPGVERAVREALAVFVKEGAKLEEVSLSLTDHGLAVYYIIQPAEASA